MFLSLQLYFTFYFFKFLHQSLIITISNINFISLNFSDLFLFSFQLIQFFLNVGVIEISNVLAKVELRRLIVLPIWIFKDVMLLIRVGPVTGTSFLILKFFGCLLIFWSFDFLKDRLWDDWWSDNSLDLWLSNMNSVQNIFCFLWIFCFLSKSVIK